MDETWVREWYDRYLTTFARWATRESDDGAELLACYAVPLLVTTHAMVRSLSTAEDVSALLEQQVQEARAAGYHHSDVIDFAVTTLSATTSLLRVGLMRVDGDGGEIERLTATYLLIDDGAGLQAAALLLHG